MRAGAAAGAAREGRTASRRARRIAVGAAAIGLASVLAPVPAAAIASAESEAAAIDVLGNVRGTLGVTQHYDAPQVFGEGNRAAAFGQAALRLGVSGRFGRVLRFEFHAEERVSATSEGSAVVQVPGMGGAPGALRTRALDATWEQEDEADLDARLDLDRANLRLSLPHVDLVVGRQAINFSKAWFWNPLDVFLPFDPRAFDREYKPGVDAARLGVAFTASAGLDVVYAPGPTLTLDLATGGARPQEGVWDATWYGSALLGRGYATAGRFDLALQGGKVYGGWQIGGGFQGEVLGFGVRGEAAYLFAEEAEPVDVVGNDLETRAVDLVPSHMDLVVGLDRRFPNSLYLAAEYFLNGSGSTDLVAAALRVAVGQTPNLSRHLLGLLVSYDVLPVLGARLSTMVSLQDGSVLLAPSLTYSLGDEAEVVAGAMVALGERPDEGLLYPEPRGEFGTWPNGYYGQVRFWF